MKKFGLMLAVIGMMNFAAFFVSSIMSGGGATGGKIENGVYYLGNHGKFKPVSREVYQRILWHERSVWITHPLAMLGFVLYGAAKMTTQRQSRASGEENG